MTEYKQYLSEMTGSPVTKHNITSDTRCPKCERYASQHVLPDPKCAYTEVEVLRLELGKLQSAVAYLFTLSDPNPKALPH